MAGSPLSSSAELARAIELTEGAAYADLLSCAPREWRCHAEKIAGGWLLLAPALDVLLFNRLVGCGVASPASNEEISRAVARLRETGVRNYGVPLSPAAAPELLAEWLAASGLTARDRWAKMYRAAGPAIRIQTDLRITEAGPEDAAAFAMVTTTAFGMPAAWRSWIASSVGRPGWRHYLAWSDSEPVAGGALFVAGDVGWLGIAGTLPAARRHGAQSALLARRIEDGLMAGCRCLVTETGEDTLERPNPSYRNTVRAGFQLAYCRPNFMPLTGTR